MSTEITLCILIHAFVQIGHSEKRTGDGKDVSLLGKMCSAHGKLLVPNVKGQCEVTIQMIWDSLACIIHRAS